MGVDGDVCFVLIVWLGWARAQELMGSERRAEEMVRAEAVNVHQQAALVHQAKKGLKSLFYSRSPTYSHLLPLP